MTERLPIQTVTHDGTVGHVTVSRPEGALWRWELTVPDLHDSCVGDPMWLSFTDALNDGIATAAAAIEEMRGYSLPVEHAPVATFTFCVTTSEHPHDDHQVVLGRVNAAIRRALSDENVTLIESGWTPDRDTVADADGGDVIELLLLRDLEMRRREQSR